MDLISKENNTPYLYNINNYINNLCVIKTAKHFLCCPCCKKEYDIIYNKLYKEELEEAANNPNIGGSIKSYRLAQLPEKARNILLSVIEERTCPYELEELYNTVKLLEDKYDMIDPRVFMIVKSILDIQLTAYRMQKESNLKGVVIDFVDNKGEFQSVVNPVEEVKRRFNETLIKGVETLNKMIEGEKHLNVNVDLKDRVFKRDELHYDD